MRSKLPAIILASRSERRSSLLDMCRVPHKVMVSGAREDKGRKGDRPDSLVTANALKKAGRVASSLESGIVIGADTVVYLDGDIIGKLKSKDKVKEVLGRLSEKASYVYSGLAVIDAAAGRRAVGCVKTKIRMKKIEEGYMDKWLAHIGPFDRAGGFSIEGPGSILFPHIEGCYFNILGLPMSKLYDLFKEIGYDLLDFMTEGR